MEKLPSKQKKKAYLYRQCRLRRLFSEGMPKKLAEILFDKIKDSIENHRCVVV